MTARGDFIRRRSPDRGPSTVRRRHARSVSPTMMPVEDSKKRMTRAVQRGSPRKRPIVRPASTRRMLRGVTA